jgi:hypothetical protein
LANKYSPYPGDIVDAKLEPGEYVLNRNAVKAIGKENLNMLNHEMAPRFSEGGYADANRMRMEDAKRVAQGKQRYKRDLAMNRALASVEKFPPSSFRRTDQSVIPIDLQKIEVHDIPSDEFNVDDFNKYVGKMTEVAKAGDAVIPGIDLKNWKGPQSPFRATEAEQYAYQLQKDPRMLGFDLNKEQRDRIEKENPYLEAERLKGLEQLRSQYGSTASQVKAENELAMDKIRAKIKGDLDSKQLLEEQNKAIAMMNPSGAPSKPQMLPGIPYETMENYRARMEALDKEPKKQLAMKDIPAEIEKISKVSSKQEKKSLKSGLASALRNFRAGMEKGSSPEFYAQTGKAVPFPGLRKQTDEDINKILGKGRPDYTDEDIEGIDESALFNEAEMKRILTRPDTMGKDDMSDFEWEAWDDPSEDEDIRKASKGMIASQRLLDEGISPLGGGKLGPQVLPTPDMRAMPMSDEEWERSDTGMSSIDWANPQFGGWDKDVVNRASQTLAGKAGASLTGGLRSLRGGLSKASTYGQAGLHKLGLDPYNYLKKGQELQEKSDSITAKQAYGGAKDYLTKGAAENYEDVLTGKEKGSLLQRGGKGLGMLSSLLTYASGSGMHNLDKYGRYKPTPLKLKTIGEEEVEAPEEEVVAPSFIGPRTGWDHRYETGGVYDPSFIGPKRTGAYRGFGLGKRRGGFISGIGHYQDGGHVSMNNSRRLFDMARRNYG